MTTAHSSAGPDAIDPGRLRAIEYGRRFVITPVAAVGCSRYVGRVGALAIALGIGSALGAMPVAFADRSGPAGSVGDEGSSSAASAGPRRQGRTLADRALPHPASAAAAVSPVPARVAGSKLLSWLGSGDSGGGPVSAPLAWTMLAASRRELGTAPTATPAVQARAKRSVAAT